jgi:endonuclease/exonuclease/phosphatase family metal-dependent hydrolase
VPGPKDLWAISVHLLTNAMSRPLEATQLVQHVMNDLPAGDYVVLGGDLNTDTSTEPLFTTFAQVFVVQPQATDQFDNPGTNTNRNIRLADGGLDPLRNKPYDWVMPNVALMARMVPVVLTDGVTTLVQPTGFVIDTRVFDGGTLGVLAPAQLGDSAAVNMQHMGVIRDFDLPL